MENMKGQREGIKGQKMVKRIRGRGYKGLEGGISGQSRGVIKDLRIRVYEGSEWDTNQRVSGGYING